ERQIRFGQADERSAVGGRLGGRLLEALDGAIEALARPPMEEVPASADELVRLRHVDPMSELRTVDDPSSELAEALPDLADRDVHGMARDDGAVPRFFNHLLIADGLAGMSQQHAEREQALRPQPDF